MLELYPVYLTCPRSPCKNHVKITHGSDAFYRTGKFAGLKVSITHWPATLHDQLLEPSERPAVATLHGTKTQHSPRSPSASSDCDSDGGRGRIRPTDCGVGESKRALLLRSSEKSAMKSRCFV